MPIYLWMNNDQGGDEKWKNIWCNIGHVDSSATGSLLKQFLHDQLFIYSRSVTQRSWKRREGVGRRSCISIIIPWRSCTSRGPVTQFVGESYDGRAAVPSISREGVTQKSCRVTATQSIIKVTEQSVCWPLVFRGNPGFPLSQRPRRMCAAFADAKR